MVTEGPRQRFILKNTLFTFKLIYPNFLPDISSEFSDGPEGERFS